MSTSGGSSGGASVTFCAMSASFEYDFNGTSANLQAFESQVNDPVGLNNSWAGGLTSPPCLVATASTVVAVEQAGVSQIDTTNDSFIVNATLIVSNLAGTEVLMVAGATTVAVAGPNQSGTIDWTTATVTPVAGTDLTWDGSSTVSSTLGGVFVSALSYDMFYN